MLLPKKLTPESRIHLIHTSSPVGKSDWQTYQSFIKKITKLYPNTKAFDVERRELDPRYLAASEGERLKQFRLALKDAEWLAPVYGGTGCGDIIRHMNEEDLKFIKANRPIVNGFSDTTFLINYLFLEADLLTFHYTNATGLFANDNSDLFFDLLKGKINSLSYREPGYHWLTEPPQRPIRGTAIGGNIETFRDMLDLMRYGSASWKPFILFMEDIGLDAEDYHKIVISLDQRKLFRQIRAVVIGRMDERAFETAERRYDVIFGGRPSQPGIPPSTSTAPAEQATHADHPTEANQDVHHYFKYLVSDIIEERQKAKDPLYILRVDNLGHNVEHNPMILPIGGRTSIYPGGRIEFRGPFVQ